MVKSLSIKYDRHAFFGGYELAEDYTFNVSHENVKKMFSALTRWRRTSPMSTHPVLWFNMDDYSLGVTYDSVEDSIYKKCKVITQKTGSLDTTWEYMPFNEIKRRIYDEVDSVDD